MSGEYITEAIGSAIVTRLAVAAPAPAPLRHITEGAMKDRLGFGLVTASRTTAGKHTKPRFGGASRRPPHEFYREGTDMALSIPSLPADKANQYLWGTVAAAVAVPIGDFFGMPRGASAMTGSVSAGLLKVLLDFAMNVAARRRGEVEPHGIDFYGLVATAAGGLSLAGVSIEFVGGVAHG